MKFEKEEDFEKWLDQIHNRLEKLEKAIEKMVKDNEDKQNEKNWTRKYFKS